MSFPEKNKQALSLCGVKKKAEEMEYLTEAVSEWFAET